MAEPTKEQRLLAYGFKKSESPFTPYVKDILGLNTLTLVITYDRNKAEFGLQTPDGTIYLNCNLDQLAIIEKAVMGYGGFAD